MGKPIYIHYGSDKFEPEQFAPVTNFILNKPQGGFWASRTDSIFGWYDWCKSEEFCLERLIKSFKFTLSDNANILYLRKHSDLDKLASAGCYDLLPSYDFPKMLEQGIDAIELENPGEFMIELMSWDCQSIFIMNPDIIERYVE